MYQVSGRVDFPGISTAARAASPAKRDRGGTSTTTKLGDPVSAHAFSTADAEDYASRTGAAGGDGRRAPVATGLRLADHRDIARESAADAPAGTSRQEERKVDFACALGARLREARRQRGLTLQNVESGSDGEFTSAALSSYERGDRMMSVERLVDLANFYGMSAADLLPSRCSLGSATTSILSVDLLRVAKLPPYQAGPLLEAARAAATRGSTKFSLSGERLEAVARAYGLPADEVVDLLTAWDVFSPASA